MTRTRSLAVVCAAIVLTVFVAGCDSFMLEDQFTATENAGTTDSELPLSVSPSIVSIGFGKTVSFEGTGGVSPYTFGLDNETLGTIDASTGAFSAGTVAANGIVSLTDAAGTTAGAVVYVYDDTSGAALSLSVQETDIGRDESVRLYPAGGVPPYTLSVPGTPSDGRTHTDVYPASPTADQRGSIRNNDTYEPGDFLGTVYVRVTDSEGSVAERAIRVVPEAPSSFSGQGFGQPDLKVALSWSYSGPGVRFDVRWSDDNATFSPLASLALGTVSYEHTGLTNGSPYWYRIVAVAEGDASYVSTVATTFAFAK